MLSLSFLDDNNNNNPNHLLDVWRGKQINKRIHLTIEELWILTKELSKECYFKFLVALSKNCKQNTLRNIIPLFSEIIL